MAPLPIVAIVGRPNVGKSSLFNALAGKRISIVDPTAGVTRDRISTVVRANDRYFELVDTGGIGIEDADDLTEDVERQIDAALAMADVVLFVVDIRAGVVPLDEEVARRLRAVQAPIILVANKADTPEVEALAADFYRLGRGKPLCVSAEHRRGKQDLLEAIVSKLPPPQGDEAPPRVADLKLAIVGRRNTGKSTFINCVAESERMIVSEVAGTTRDSVDVRFERDGKVIVAIDTAGVRRKKSIASDVEFYSFNRAQKSIRRADVVLLFFDARLRVSKVDKQIADAILQENKPAVFVVNKWDLVKDSIPTEYFGNYLRKIFPMLDYVPIAFITAKDGRNVTALLNLARNLHKQAGVRVNTGDLNRVVREALNANPPPMRQNRRPKVFYATQAGTLPPTIVLFTNGPELFDQTYQRYLIGYLRDRFPFREVPLNLVLRARKHTAAPSGERDTIERPAPPAEPPRRKKKTPDQKKAPDLAGLEFVSEGDDAEVERDLKHYESELWNI